MNDPMINHWLNNISINEIAFKNIMIGSLQQSLSMGAMTVVMFRKFLIVIERIMASYFLYHKIDIIDMD